MRAFRFLSFAAFAVASAVAAFTPARASTIVWNYWGDFSNNTGRPDVGSGTLTITPDGSAFLVTGITGTMDGAAITSILPPGSCCAAPNNDNLLFLNSTALLDLDGIAFSTATANFNLYYGGINGLTQAAMTPYADIANPGSGYGVFAVPEPSTVALFGLGFAGLLMMRRLNA